MGTEVKEFQAVNVSNMDILEDAKVEKKERIPLKSHKWLVMRGILYLGVYGILHYIYVWLPYVPFAIFGGTNESIFTHMKLAFWSYVLTTFVEWILYKKVLKRGLGDNYWLLRAFSAMLTGWFLFLLWYIVPAFTHVEPLWAELLWSFAVLFILAYFLGIFEKDVRVHVGREAKGVVWGLFVLSIFIYTIFTFVEAYIDVFHGKTHADH